MRCRVLTLSALLLLAGSAPAHHRQYQPPIPPPEIEREPDPEVTPPDSAGPVTPPVRPGLESPGGGSPGRPETPSGPRASREDDRASVRVWWELHRHRFLPAHRHLPFRDELVAVLLDASDSESEVLRGRALLSLARLREGRAAERIRAAAAKGSDSGRALAILALGLLGDPADADRLRTGVRDGSLSIHLRALSAFALGLLGDPEEGKFLRAVADKEWEPSIRGAAVLALGCLGDAAAADTLGRILLDRHPVVSPEETAGGNHGPKTWLRCAAALALSRLPEGEGTPFLISALAATSGTVRDATATALGSIPGGDAAALRTALARPGSPGLRLEAVLALGARGDPAARAIAGEALEDPVDAAGPFAALALGLSGEPEDAAPLVAVLGMDDLPAELEAAACLALALGGFRDAAPAVAKVVAREKGEETAGLPLVALAMLGDPLAKRRARTILADRGAPSGLRRDAATALGLTADESDRALLLKTASGSCPEAVEALAAVARLDPPAASRALLERLRAPETRARRDAAIQIGALLAEDPPGRLTLLLETLSPLPDAPIGKALLYLENEPAYHLLWRP